MATIYPVIRMREAQYIGHFIIVLFILIEERHIMRADEKVNIQTTLLSKNI
jgi:hypothetical protein